MGHEENVAAMVRSLMNEEEALADGALRMLTLVEIRRMHDEVTAAVNEVAAFYYPDGYETVDEALAHVERERQRHKKAPIMCSME